jgi:hypothetical protein
MDEALLRVARRGITDGLEFFGAYRAESGDECHRIGGMMFRLDQMKRILREPIDDALLVDLKVLSDADRIARRAATKPAKDAPPRETLSDDIAESTGAAILHAGKPLRSKATEVDGIVYIGTSEVSMLLGGTGHKIPVRCRPVLTPHYGLSPKMARSIALYSRDEVVALAAKMAAKMAAEAAEAEAIMCDTAPGEVILLGEACVDPKRAGEILGLDARRVGTDWGHRLSRRYHPRSPTKVWYTRASIDAIREEREGTAAKAELLTANKPAEEALLTAPAPKAVPVTHLSEMDLPERLAALGRALASGILSETEYGAKVRAIVLGG